MKHVFKFEIDDKGLSIAEKGLLLAFRDVLTKSESRFLVKHIILIGSYVIGLFISKMPLEELLANTHTFVLARFSRMMEEVGSIMVSFWKENK